MRSRGKRAHTALSCLMMSQRLKRASLGCSASRPTDTYGANLTAQCDHRSLFYGGELVAGCIPALTFGCGLWAVRSASSAAETNCIMRAPAGDTPHHRPGELRAVNYFFNSQHNLAEPLLGTAPTQRRCGHNLQYEYPSKIIIKNGWRVHF